MLSPLLIDLCISRRLCEHSGGHRDMGLSVSELNRYCGGRAGAVKSMSWVKITAVLWDKYLMVDCDA